MLVEYISAVIFKDDKYLIEAVQKEDLVFGGYPQIRAINAIADKKDILKYKMASDYKIEVDVGDCLFLEEFEQENDVLSYSYYICSMEKGGPFDSLIWIYKDELERVNFSKRDAAATKIICRRDKKTTGESYE